MSDRRISEKFTSFSTDVFYIDGEEKRCVRHDDYKDFQRANKYFLHLKECSVDSNTEVELTAKGKIGHSNISCLLAKLTSNGCDLKDEYNQFIDDLNNRQPESTPISPEVIRQIILSEKLVTLLDVLYKDIKLDYIDAYPEELRDKLKNFYKNTESFRKDVLEWIMYYNKDIYPDE